MCRVADVHLQALFARRNRQPLIAQLTDDVKRLPRWLLERQAQLVRRDRTLDLGPHVRRDSKVAVRGHVTVERLMRPLEVVVTHVVLEPPLRILGVREDGATQELVPQRLPEALCLAERLRMLRPTADVVDAPPRQHLLEFGLAAPHRVLPTVVGQDLRRLTVRRVAALEGLHHQRRLLVMRHRVPHDEAAVVIHEHAHVQPLCTPQPKREDVRLPKLIRCRTLEAPRQVLPLHLRHRRLDEFLLVQNPPYLLLRNAERFEACQYVTNSPRSPLLVFPLQRHHPLALHGVRCLARRVLLRTP